MNNNITVIQGYSDPLLDRYNELAFMQNIDAQEYSAAWKLLGEMCEAENRPALAAMCFSRSDYYGRYTGEAVRLIEGSLSEMIEA